MSDIVFTKSKLRLILTIISKKMLSEKYITHGKFVTKYVAKYSMTENVTKYSHESAHDDFDFLGQKYSLPEWNFPLSDLLKNSHS